MFEIPKENMINKKLIMLFIFTIITVTFSIILFFNPSSHNKPEYETSVVTSRAFKSSINTYGKLRAKLRQGIIAKTSGHITSIYLRPGAQLKLNSKIMQLSNLKLVKQLEDSQLTLLEEKSNFEKLRADLALVYTRQEADIELAKAQLELAKVDLKANQQLKDSNVISALQYEKVKVSYLKDNTTLSVEKKKIISLAKSHEAALTSSKYRIERAKAKIATIEEDIQNLSLNASMSGVLMTLDKELEIGQYVTEGQYIGTVVNNDSLYAELVVSASDANKLQLENQVDVVIKGKTVSGYITRVAPTVVNGSVEVDVEFKQPLPDSALPNIDVTGQINVVNLKTALVSDRPSWVNESHKQYPLLVMKKNTKHFQKVMVLIGEINKDKMQVLSPLVEGDIISINTSEELEHSPEIYLANYNE